MHLIDFLLIGGVVLLVLLALRAVKKRGGGCGCGCSGCASRGGCPHSRQAPPQG